MLHRVALVRTDVTKEHIVSMIRVKIISELRTMREVSSHEACCEELLLWLVVYIE
jgi:hypothetical protein